MKFLPDFLKDSASFMKLPVRFLINMSISENCVPYDMKKARVKPLFKKSSNLDVGNCQYLKYHIQNLRESNLHTTGEIFSR